MEKPLSSNWPAARQPFHRAGEDGYPFYWYNAGEHGQELKDKIDPAYPVVHYKGGVWVYKREGNTLTRVVLLNKWSDCREIAPKVLKTKDLS